MCIYVVKVRVTYRTNVRSKAGGCCSHSALCTIYKESFAGSIHFQGNSSTDVIVPSRKAWTALSTQFSKCCSTSTISLLLLLGTTALTALICGESTTKQNKISVTELEEQVHLNVWRWIFTMKMLGYLQWHLETWSCVFFFFINCPVSLSINKMCYYIFALSV